MIFPGSNVLRQKEKEVFRVFSISAAVVASSSSLSSSSLSSSSPSSRRRCFCLERLVKTHPNIIYCFLVDWLLPSMLLCYDRLSRHLNPSFFRVTHGRVRAAHVAFAPRDHVRVIGIFAREIFQVIVLFSHVYCRSDRPVIRSHLKELYHTLQVLSFLLLLLLLSSSSLS